MANISISRLDVTPVSMQNTEYVERKGLGHPDSLIDGIVDATSVELSRRYLEEFGTILHHNVDKGLIIGGASRVGFGRGAVTKRIEVIVAGRAARGTSNNEIDVNELARETAAKYLKGNTRFLNVDDEVLIQSKIADGSADLTGIFGRGNGVPLANDTSFGIGFAPFTDTERLVLATEHYLNSREYKRRMPMVGEDVKVMGMRDKDSISLTVAIAFVAQHVKDIGAYREYKARIAQDIIKNARKITEKRVAVHINTGDPEGGGDVYLTKTGLSCEAGDDGSVGRGNRVNGLITPFRHMSLEAAAGKNPISHIGKIYNILATQLAQQVTGEYPAIKECDVAVLSQIGKPISEPHNLNLNIISGKSDFEKLSGKARYMVQGYLENIGELTRNIALGKYPTF
ncbi:MAG: methionine adenosyltransferase [Candidatus Marsarchaeota archaeon]|nr:methionine adenosyltransferase [Candidatus Marsarchaeota archaeon]